MHWQLIESDQALAAKLEQVAAAKVVLVDTEFMRRNTFYPQVALLQLCFVDDSTGEDTAWLIDPLSIADKAPLISLLTNPAILKVLHSPSEDLEVFQHWLGVLPQPMFDTQRAAALLDRGFGLGYRALVLELCDVDLPKGETQSNWLQRPLTPSQCEYAGLDVTWLLRVWRVLHEACEQAGKLDWLLADGADAIASLASGKSEFYRRIKTAWRLEPRELGVLVAVCAWREDTARRLDKPRSWIIDDQACLQLAQRDPHNRALLEADIELPPAAVRRHGQNILEVLEQQRAVPVTDLPAKLPAPLDGTQRNTLKKLKAQAKDLARSLSVAPQILLPAKDYELLLREASGEVIDMPLHWRGWREQEVLAPLRQFLAERSQ